MNAAVRKWTPAIVWAAVLFALSSRSTLPADLSGGLDKIAHFGGYIVLCVLLARGARASRLAAGWPVMLGLVYAASDEFHQYFVPGRSPDIADWMADALGIAAGCLFRCWLRADRALSRPAAEDVSPDSVRT